MKKTGLPLITLMIIFSACGNENDASDAYGNFESIPVMVAAESAGKIVSLELEEGQKLEPGQVLGVIDTMQLHLKLEQLDASIRAVNSRSATLEAQLRTQSIQINTMEREGRRIENLLKDGAATPKQKDDIEAGMEVLLSQMKGLETQKATIAAEKNTLRVQKEQLRDQIRRSLITNPIEGVVLQKYKQEGEIVGPGQAIYKIADLDILILRAYISGKQLSSVSIGQNVIVRIDGPDGLEEMEGKVEWISSQAEFTPKIIQTREERVNLVYAIKVQVKNDGRLKIGMPGEIKL